jgi:endoglucanase
MLCNIVTSLGRLRWRPPVRLSCALLLGAVAVFTGAANAQGTGYWHTSGNQILDANNQPVRIAGVNWYGFETVDQVAHGLWAQDYHTILDTIKSNGYNVIRLPFSSQMVERPIVPTNIQYSNSNGPINTDLQNLTSMQIMDKVISYAGKIGLRVILDNHRSTAGSDTETGLWYTSQYPESNWLEDWKVLAQRYLNNTTVIGADLRNEPHNAGNGGACWDCGTPAYDWHLAAQRGGNAVLSVNPKLLIFVEGTDCYNGDCNWWGGNLQGVQNSPVTLSVPNQLVYSAHDYGPKEAAQSWFNGSTTYDTLVAKWTQNWGYISLNNLAPVWIGEFGTTNNSRDIQDTVPGSQGQWFSSLVRYLSNNYNMSWTYWALNGEDNYGLLDSNYDPLPANSLKQQLLAGIQSSVSGSTGNGGGTVTPPPVPQIPAAPGNLVAGAVSSSQVNLAWSASSTGGATYDVYASTTAGFSPSTATRIVSGLTGTSFQQQGLSGSTTYYYLITAVNGAGESAGSNQASATTRAVASSNAACQVNLSITQRWSGGFTATVSITNNGNAPINGWTLTWTWPGTQSVQSAWNSNYAQSGNNASLSSVDFNSSIPVGNTLAANKMPGLSVGYNANTANVLPRVFSLNGVQCTNANAAKFQNIPDFDGDGQLDFTVWRPSNGTWFSIQTSHPTTPTMQQWGLPGDVPAAGDFDGDGKTDFAVWRPANGTWYIIPSSNPAAPYTQQWGLPGDVPVPGDYDGDGKTDFVVWRPVNGTWYIIPSSNPGALVIQQWGLKGDVPLVGDFDNDGKADFAVWRPVNGTWYIIPSSNPGALVIQQWGLPGDVPMVGDYDNDGKLDFVVWRPGNGTWYVIPSSHPGAPIIQQWGLPGDKPIAGDFDSDGKLDFAVWRPANGTWYVIPSSNPYSPVIQQWGWPGDSPIQANLR